MRQIQILRTFAFAAVVAGSTTFAFAEQPDTPIHNDGDNSAYGQGMMGGHNSGMMMGNANSVSRNTEHQPVTQSETISRGEQLEQEFCIQCHAMPDPRQHTAQQWPYVVARMNNYMHFRNMSAPDAQQAHEIIEYLAKHAPY